MADQPKSGGLARPLILVLGIFVVLLCGFPVCCAKPRLGPAPADIRAWEQQEAREAADRAWKVTEEKSPIDDSQTVIASKAADQTWTDWLHQEHRPVLLLRCKENQTEVYVDLGGPAEPELGLISQATVTLRIDDEKAQEIVAGTSASSDAAFIPKPIPFLKSLEGKKKLLIQWTALSKGHEHVTFDISEAAAPIGKVSAGCHW